MASFLHMPRGLVLFGTASEKVAVRYADPTNEYGSTSLVKLCLYFFFFSVLFLFQSRNYTHVTRLESFVREPV